VGAVLIVLGLAGCQMFRPNPGRFQAWVAAAHAGQFHRAFRRWPADLGELAALDCPRLDEAVPVDTDPALDGLPPIRDDVCAFLVKFPYRIEMSPDGPYLRMVFRSVDGQVMCKLRVATPRNDTAAALAPSVRIRTTAFACPGEGEFR
jgi:hypothetical protein